MRPPRSFQYNLAKLRVTDGVQELASVDAFAADVFTSFDVGVTPSTTYYLEITGCQQTGANQDCLDQRSEQYEAIVVGLPSPAFESEPNNTLAQADVVSPNAWIFAQHSMKTDVDIFRIDVPSAGELFAHLSRPSDQYVYSLSKIELLDASGNVLSGDDVFAPNGQGRAVLGVSGASVIYLRVTSCASGSRCDIIFSNPYQVVIGFRADGGSTCPIFRNGFECTQQLEEVPNIFGNMQGKMGN